jgi:hypothetical protein
MLISLSERSHGERREEETNDAEVGRGVPAPAGRGPGRLLVASEELSSLSSLRRPGPPVSCTQMSFQTIARQVYPPWLQAVVIPKYPTPSLGDTVVGS